MDWAWKIGLAFAVILLAIPVVMVGFMVFGIVQGYLEHRRRERSRVVHHIPSLGELWSWDRNLWFGDVNGVHICLTTQEQLPAADQVSTVRKLLDMAPELERLGQDFLSRNEECGGFDGGADGFALTGLDVEEDGSFTVQFGHESDSDGVYTVEFRGGLPVSSYRDD
jgi:hypothetical protein